MKIEGYCLPETKRDGDDKDVERTFRKAIGEASIIITATSSTSPLFPSSCVSPGTHLCLIGSYKLNMHEIDPELVKRGGKIVVDSRESCQIEAGELIAASVGVEDMIEIGELVEDPSKTSPGDTKGAESKVALVRSAGDVTIFKSVGVGVQDVAITSVVVDRAGKMGLGASVEL